MPSSWVATLRSSRHAGSSWFERIARSEKAARMHAALQCDDRVSKAKFLLPPSGFKPAATASASTSVDFASSVLTDEERDRWIEADLRQLPYRRQRDRIHRPVRHTITQEQELFDKPTASHPNHPADRRPCSRVACRPTSSPVRSVAESAPGCPQEHPHAVRCARGRDGSECSVRASG